MKIGKKLLSLLLIAALTVGITACGGGDAAESTASATTTTAATTDPDAELKEVDWSKLASDTVDLESENGAGKLYESGKTAGVVHALCYYDLATSTDDKKYAALLAERFGGSIETEITSSGSAYFETLGVKVMADDAPDIVRYDWMAYPCGISKNLFMPLDDWLDIDAPLWVDEKDIIESFSYAGKHYYFPSALQPNFVMIYDRLKLDEAGLSDPYDNYKEGTWTWDVFEEMCKEWVLQGEDYIGFTGGSWSSMMFANSTGTKIIDMTGTDIINNMKNEQVQRTMDWLSEMKKTGLIGDGFVGPGEAFLEGKLLFLGMGLTWGFESAQDGAYKNGLTSEFVALPFPRDPNSDKYYLASDTFGFMVPAGAKNVQGAISWILCGRMYQTDPECVAAEYKIKTNTDPVYFPKCPECKYNFVENSKDDLDTCPECGAARKRKFAPVYSPEQMEIIADMKDPSKFTHIFDNSVGFDDDFSTLFTGGEDSLYDGPIYYGASYSQLRDINMGVVDAYLDPYRATIREAVSANAAG